MSVSLKEQADACAREVVMRRRVYARWVQDGRMSQEKADAEIAAMAAAAGTLRAMLEREKAQGDLLG